MTRTPFSGIPHILKMDGWWLDTSNAPKGTSSGTAIPRHLPPLAALALLTGLADLLFRDHPVGLSLALFAAAVFGLATRDLPLARKLRPAILLALGCLPVIEYLQPLSLGFLLTGLAGSLVWARVQDSDPWLATGLAWLRRLPSRWLAPFRYASLRRAGRISGDLARHTALALPPLPYWRAALRDWGFPLGGAMIFGGLVLRANPLILQALDWDVDLADLIEHILFWAGVALILFPLLERDLPKPATLPDLPNLGPRLGVNRRSILRALLTFNAIVAVQTLTDALIVLGGASLPKGMTYAEYAHRGAYPLLITALLACGVALAARPFLREHRSVKPLLLLWLGQNMMLTGGAVLRLELYVGTYGLTYLRVHAFLWMGLVAVLLSLCTWQVLRARSNRWLVWRACAAGIALLYTACFVNFAALIAGFNLAHPGGLSDPAYLCDLGHMAWAEMQSPEAPACGLSRPDPEGWRDWGFRKVRVAG